MPSGVNSFNVFAVTGLDINSAKTLYLRIVIPVPTKSNF